MFHEFPPPSLGMTPRWLLSMELVRKWSNQLGQDLLTPREKDKDKISKDKDKISKDKDKIGKDKDKKWVNQLSQLTIIIIICLY